MTYKLTPEAHSKIKQLALTLPELQKWEGGKPMFKKEGRVIGYEKTPQAKSIVEFDRIPVLVNHEVHMISEFKKGGMVKVLEYCAGVNLIVKKFNEKQKQNERTTKAATS